MTNSPPLGTQSSAARKRTLTRSLNGLMNRRYDDHSRYSEPEVRRSAVEISDPGRRATLLTTTQVPQRDEDLSCHCTGREHRRLQPSPAKVDVVVRQDQATIMPHPALSGDSSVLLFYP